MVCIASALKEAQQKRDRLNSKALFICQHTGAQFDKEYQALCVKVRVTTINGHQLTNQNREHVEESQKKAMTTLF